MVAAVFPGLDQTVLAAVLLLFHFQLTYSKQKPSPQQGEGGISSLVLALFIELKLKQMGFGLVEMSLEMEWNGKLNQNWLSFNQN